MQGPCEFEQIAGTDPRLALLIAEARAQGFPFMDTLVRDWADGSNRFDRPGECYLAAIVDGLVVGAGGINRDPYSDHPAVGRVRHVYVLDSARRSGVGRALLAELVARARPSFDVLRLRTRTERGAAFYEALEFEAVGDETATHILLL